jgi:membrane peptidoglycan carboxypeptidase
VAGQSFAGFLHVPVQRFAARPRLKWWVSGAALVAILGYGATLEARTSYLQSLLFTRMASEMSFDLGAGPSSRIRFPKGGPYDQRLGYTQLPSFIEALKSRHFTIERQAEISPALEQFSARHGYALYHEKEAAGLSLRDRSGAPLYQANYPERIYESFGSIPPLLVSTLLFIENRSILETEYPYRNPAVEWQRFFLAAGGQVAGLVNPRLQQGGGSTLATQIEKFEHADEGRTKGITDKLLQMIAASARAYTDGRDTTEARKRIVTAYLNATPLSSRPGYGEIIGIADGLRAWYGTGFAEANTVLSETATGNVGRKAEVYKQVLSLLMAQRRPSYYLTTDRQALEAITDNQLRLLAKAGIISPQFRDAALQTQLKFRDQPPMPAPVSFVGRKAANAIRTELLGFLKAPNLYSLDRVDLRATTSIDAGVQHSVSQLLGRLKSPDEVKALGMIGDNLLGAQDPAQVAYSVVIYEREADRNVVRVHADSLDEPFDINTGAKLILGSTAKFRTLLTYLDIIARLHDRYAQATPAQLQTAAREADDPLTQFVASYLTQNSDRSLKATLEASMQRRYSGNPGQAFFTGGGRHIFHNFEKSEDSKLFTVEDAFANSVNLAFIRLLRDITDYYKAERATHQNEVGTKEQSSSREAYLERFADQEGSTYLNRFYKDFAKRSPDEILSLLARKSGGVPNRLAVVFRSVRPEGSMTQFRDFLKRESRRPVDEKTVPRLYEDYGPDRYSLADRGYLAKLHPLELWLAQYLTTHPGATRSQVIADSTEQRLEVYGWLFKSKRPHKQDVRIRIVTEEDAFAEILKDWRKQGYPFDHLVPSLATAIGSSGDRPEALSELMGIVLNDGVQLSTLDVGRLQFAAGTPYETDLSFKPAPPKRIFAPEVAAIARRALGEVVTAGTATRLRGTYYADDGTPLALGGKTGTGDNRLDQFGPGQQLISSQAVDRTATFVFFLGDRFFGTVTAFVRGPEAAKYHFTSALSVQLLKALAPQLQPLLKHPRETGSAPVATSSETSG